MLFRTKIPNSLEIFLGFLHTLTRINVQLNLMAAMVFHCLESGVKNCLFVDTFVEDYRLIEWFGLEGT